MPLTAKPANVVDSTAPLKQQQNLSKSPTDSTTIDKLNQADKKSILQEMFDEQINSRANSREKAQQEQQVGLTWMWLLFLETDRIKKQQQLKLHLFRLIKPN